MGTSENKLSYDLLKSKVKFENLFSQPVQTTNPRRNGAGGESHIKVTGCSFYLLGVKNVVLVPLRVFSFKTSFKGRNKVEIYMYDSAF